MSDYQLNTNQYLSDCDPKDVIFFSHNQLSSISKMKEIIYNALINSGISSIVSYILDYSNFSKTTEKNNRIKTWFYDGE